MQVMINGVAYAPVSDKSPSRIGIAITTHNRHEVLSRALAQHFKHMPAGAYVVVVDDGSINPVTVPEGVTLIRHEQSLGIVASKNASLEALMDAGCEHLFLWDDDAWPIADDWEKPYIASPEPHLAYQFLDLAGPNKINDMTILFQDDQHIAYSGQRGVMLYFHRQAIETVGGFDPVYGRGMYEHPDLALRIHVAGLTSFAFGDVVNSNTLIHSLDEHCKVNRSVPRQDREALVSRNVGIYNHRRDTGYAGYAPFRRMHDVVITSLLTSQIDPQRGVKPIADATQLSKWAGSIRKAEAIVLADELTTAPEGVKLVAVPPVKMSPYFYRWQCIYQYLRAHPECRNVWCTDGTDVEMLHEPWEEMEPGKIYVGSEPSIYNNIWMKRHHPAKFYQDFFNRHGNDTLLNAGLLGGSREDVMAFAHGIIQLNYRLESWRFWKMETAPPTLVDMGAFGVVAKSFGDRIVTGPRVHTVFKQDGVGKDCAWWKHK
ncbi:glycosyl transferase [Serratia marcescens]|nr:glycosyl transferase [Serratia marcescens]